MPKSIAGKIGDLTPSELEDLLVKEVGLRPDEMFVAFGANPYQHDESVILSR
jgi:hypothetical protein